MTGTIAIEPLGLVLQKAGLVSPEQIELVVEEKLDFPDIQIGKLMAKKGWIKPETADFFAEKWPKLVIQKPEQPIGQYLKAAGLVDRNQIDRILEEQKNTQIKFGDLAVFKGFISQTTLDFFLEYVNSLETEILRNQLSLPVTEVIEDIEKYIINNQNCNPEILLKRYERVWEQREILATGDLPEMELIKSGIVVRKDSFLRISRLEYRFVFDFRWIQKQLALLHPYNKIRLKMFGLESKASVPYKILDAVVYWTENEPFLTQKVCQLIANYQSVIPVGKESFVVESLVEKYIINHWQSGSASQHFQEISDRLIHNKNCSPKSLLNYYRYVWQKRQVIAANSNEELELISLGLIKLEYGKVSVKNPIYEMVFNRSWIEEQLKFCFQDNESSSIGRSSRNKSKSLYNYSSQKSTSYSHKKNFLYKLVAIFALVIGGSGIAFLINKIPQEKKIINPLTEGYQLLDRGQDKEAL